MKRIYSMALLCVIVAGKAQVGINTQNPQAIFHVDGAKNNPSTGAPSTPLQADDFVVTKDGNVGIGTTTPTRKLEIVSATSPALKISDGTQQNNYVLMSDANGYGSWQATTTAVLADFPTTGYSQPITTGANAYIGVSLTVPPGNWLVVTNVVLTAKPVPAAGTGIWARLYWANDTAGSSTGSYGGFNSGVLISPFGNAIGSTILKNQTSANKTFYLTVGGVDFYGGYTGSWDNLGIKRPESSIIAYPAN